MFAHPFSTGVIYRERLFTLCRSTGPLPFRPQAHGITPESVYVGALETFQDTYGISGGALFIEHCRLRLPYIDQLRIRAGKGPLLLGRAARVEPEETLCVVYENLHTPMSFTGGMLVGDGYILMPREEGRERQVRESTAHPIFEWRELGELLFEEGHLTEARDITEAAARLRQDLTTGPHEPGSPEWKTELATKVSPLFRRDYGGLEPRRRFRAPPIE
ncbi:hypothetical protein HPC49_11645 [Pyxidicoccus fallax]|uniref:Uncharacterized protein n=1 Tax=Pyxidicoccus fallax TaxID=394095 RepID=A0A848LB99_9BACT|nr:hypothetical protein [Pyxidicoccus fallax]NMO16189.1 hypothetical protein [Pyxidicoccus fallax]NPC78893.1 hypothetical protein [Pyxidicoccus fallax]